MKDVTIIGAGIAGAFIARELSRFDLSVLILDKENDVGNGTTMANSAIIHAGYDAVPGTLKRYYNIAGNPMFDDVCRELDVPFKRIGSLVLAFGEDDEATLRELYERGAGGAGDRGAYAGDGGACAGDAPAVPGMHLLSREEVLEMEPHINEDVTAALHAPTAGIVSPYELAVALVENAMDNGAALSLNTEVLDITPVEEGYEIRTSKGTYKSRFIFNCAGVFADKIAKMAGDDSFDIKPRRGQYFVLDKHAGELFNHIIFQCPTEKGKGVLIAPTVHDTVLIGPDSVFIEDKEDLSTEGEGLAVIKETALKSSLKIPFDKVIRTYSGLRAMPSTHDFIIGEPAGITGFFNVAGFESPGLSSAPAVAEEAVAYIRKEMPDLRAKPDFNPYRRPVIRFSELPEEDKMKTIEMDKRFGHVICRCETVTEAEIIDCIHRNAGATTVKGVKKRVRPGMGRCQGGFCGPRIMEILARELGVSMDDVVYDQKDAYILAGETKASEGGQENEGI